MILGTDFFCRLQELFSLSGRERSSFDIGSLCCPRETPEPLGRIHFDDPPFDSVVEYPSNHAQRISDCAKEVGASSGTSPEEESGLRVNEAAWILEELQRRNPVTANYVLGSFHKPIGSEAAKPLGRNELKTRGEMFQKELFFEREKGDGFPCESR